MKPDREEVIKALKRILGYSTMEVLRRGPQEPDPAFINTINFLMQEFQITEDDLT